jgi:5-hydroxyisourate hydrolase
MSGITTHVLNTALGRPAMDVPVTLEAMREGAWVTLAAAATDGDGRARLSQEASQGRYRITFTLGDDAFYPEVSIQFAVRDGRHHHIPLLLSPFGYSTYRGS